VEQFGYNSITDKRTVEVKPATSKYGRRRLRTVYDAGM